jgi:hypothetical protein
MEEDLPFEVAELGVPLALAALAGVLAVLSARRPRLRLAGPLLFAGSLLALQLGYDYQPFRNLLPIVPLIIAIAVLPIARIGDRARRGTVDVAITIALFLALLPPALTIARGRHERTDSRIEARSWLEKNASASDLVLVASELRFVSRDLARLPASVEHLPAERVLHRASRVRARFVLLPHSEATAADSSVELRHAGRRMYRRRVTFGTDRPPADRRWWVGNALRIEIFELEGRRRRPAPRPSRMVSPSAPPPSGA